MIKINIQNIHQNQESYSITQYGAGLLVLAVALYALRIDVKISDSHIHEIKKDQLTLIKENPTTTLFIVAFVVLCIKTALFYLKNKMQDALELQHITHQKLHNILKKLYPDFEHPGLCFGYAVKGMNDLFKDTSSFQNTLKQLDNLMMTLSDNDFINQIKQNETLSAFFHEIYTYQTDLRSIETISTLLGSISGVYQQPSDLLYLIFNLHARLVASAIYPTALGFLIVSKKHAVVLGYSAKEHVYTLIDANALSVRIPPWNSIFEIMNMFYNRQDKSNSFNIRIYLSADNNNLNSRAVFEKWTAFVLFTFIQNLPFLSEQEKSNWLYKAAAVNDKKSVQMLINAKVNVDQGRGIDGDTALHIAAYNGYENIAHMLVKAGADVHHVVYGALPLQIALRQGHINIAQMLTHAMYS